MLQYHHHDHDGNVFVNLSAHVELEIGHAPGIHECHHKDCHDDASRNKDNDDGSCGLHLTDFDSTELGVSHLSLMPFVLLSEITTSRHLSAYDITKDYYYPDVDVIPPPLIGSLSFRAPPFA